MAHKCCSQQKVKRGLWSPEEDEKLVSYITSNGHACWSSVPKHAGLQRCGKSCRLRWINYLRPELKRGTFTAEEEQIIIDVHRMLGNRWSEIAKHLPGRTDNEVKNYWNSCIKKKLVAQGLDPKTHTLFKTSTSLIRPEKKLQRPFKLHKNSHISYTPTTKLLDHDPTRLPGHRACITNLHHTTGFDFDHVERSKSYASSNLVPESGKRFIDITNLAGILEEDGAKASQVENIVEDPHMVKAGDNSHSSSVGLMASVREDCFGNFGFELDLIDDVSCMDDLMWNSTFAT